MPPRGDFFFQKAEMAYEAYLAFSFPLFSSIFEDVF
jgi:hypothetical protein